MDEVMAAVMAKAEKEKKEAQEKGLIKGEVKKESPSPPKQEDKTPPEEKKPHVEALNEGMKETLKKEVPEDRQPVKGQEPKYSPDVLTRPVVVDEPQKKPHVEARSGDPRQAARQDAPVAAISEEELQRAKEELANSVPPPKASGGVKMYLGVGCGFFVSALIAAIYTALLVTGIIA